MTNTTTTESASNKALEDSGYNTNTEGLSKIEARNVRWYSYFTTWDFWLVVALGQFLCVCNTATSVFTTLLADYGTSVPAFQTFFNYVLLSLVYIPYMFYRYGWRKVFRIVYKDGWRYFILSFLDVEGNYFTVLAYRYTNLLSAQLLNFWSIVCVVIVSFLLLRVRYRPFQILGILVACGGMGMLLGSDAMTSGTAGGAPNKVKGDLFGLAGATCYGLSNVFEEWYVSRRPLYEVLSFMGFIGMFVGGATAAIFDRYTFQQATWNGPVIGYIVGYTLALFVFYTFAPFILRMGSAAFFDISLLTGNFWGIIIGIHVFGYTVATLYPIAFVLIILGLIVYFLAGSMLGDSKKPWLGANQEAGVAGFGTAKLKALNEARKQGMIAREQAV
ncbi:DUF914-domain-containing protein [Cryphonectria parasitica EP155]|uniref:DUF914-domain-containing protein n=1 Tax=Cryphonectria parasitica (strain ATCC 38755 / EP155) TaxID=660469 RepID=A0A9P5CP91_CRYP1|nr:DUF914-domain-containing protein [Cryphonectria parasitica EP155]KAF3765167.1 DUF914-domain-containing protein [Cryphonectria parasitica EP155]